MFRFFWIVILRASVAFGAAQQASTTSAPTSRPTTQPVSREIATLIADLRSARFEIREAAQKKLLSRREQALPFLIPLMTDPDAEVATRSAEIVGDPEDPTWRVEAAIQLLATADPDWMERGVHMLFRDPPAVCALFRERTRSAQGALRVVTEPVALHLEQSVKRYRLFQANYERIVRDKPDAAEKLRQMNVESNGYEAEAAYWTAYETLLEHRQQFGSDPKAQHPPTTQTDP